jgi:predicted nuclease of predicted toxin-antitoxin system
MLISLKHEVWDIRGTKDEGVDDKVIFDMAQKRQAIFLTTDRDFYHTVPHLYDHHFGVVVIALRQPNRQNILSRLEWFLLHFQNNSFENKIIQLRGRTYIVYPR